VRVLCGTSGFSYKEWKGSFYPEDLPAEEMLRHYASKLPAVEINNTFYRMPKASLLSQWAEQVPDGFRFVLKASQQITHRLRLKDAGQPVAYFFDVASTLGDRLGPALFQLPPNLKKDLPRLKDFLALLPPASRSAFEFRHETWFDDEVFGTPMRATAGWGYLRLRRQDYDEAALADWAKMVAGEKWDEAYVFFKHEDGGAGPKLAARFLELFRERGGSS
jgi:uncharacterized protein YecE (DUF72 family)